MRLRKDILETAEFTAMSDINLVLVNADFPRNKKNQLSSQIQKQHDALPDRYDADGKFPFTLLLDADGKVITSLDDLPSMRAAAFSDKINQICQSRK